MREEAKIMGRITLLLAAMALAVLLAALPAQAATTFTANTTTDAPDANPGDGACSTAANECTLRAAIQEANNLDGDYVIGFAPSVNGTITLGGSHLLIDSNLRISGPGADVLSVSADNKSGVFNVQGGTVEISGLTITGGSADVTNPTVLCSSARKGGGIYNEGALTLSNSTVEQNMAPCGGGIYNALGTLTLSNSTVEQNMAHSDCGGICNQAGILTVDRSTISGNTSNDGGGIVSGDFGAGPASSTITNSTISGNTATDGYGGGIWNMQPLTVSNTTISNNTANGQGGGIDNLGTLRISNSTLTDNAAENDGGGISNQRGGTSTVSNTTISNNTANGRGGGIYNYNEFYDGTLRVERSTISGNTSNVGGGVYSSTYSDSHGLSEKTTITNSTISGNTATDGYGGGLYNFSGLTDIEHSTITNNTAPSGKGSGIASEGDLDEFVRTEVFSSIISANTNTDVDFAEYPEWGAVNSFVSEGYNLIGDGNATDAFSPPNADHTGVQEPGLEPLSLNAPGSTKTHALKEGSPAFNAGPPSSECPAIDQRGVDRPQQGSCDVGSFEKEVVPYAFKGFFSPVDNPEVATNKAKAGSAIPVKFSLGGDQGLDVFAKDATGNATSPTSSALACDSTAEIDPIETTTSAGSSGLSYDAASDLYTYVWKTEKGWTGCRQLVVKFDDGTVERANFKFVK